MIPTERASSEPLSLAVFHILLALAEKDRHGYGISQDVLAQTQGRIRLSPGTLYSNLKRMLEEGLIEETRSKPDPADHDQRRRYYRLTPEGRAAAEAEVSRLEQLMRRARSLGLSAKRS